MWLFMDAAETIFRVAKHRCYIVEKLKGEKNEKASQDEVVELSGDEDAWAALDEVETTSGTIPDSWMNVKRLNGETQETAIKLEEDFEGHSTRDPRKEERRYWKQKRWLPEEIFPTLEELPKWELLSEVLMEIEDDIKLAESKGGLRGMRYLVSYMIVL